MKKASKLTPDDLMQLCIMKGIASQRAEEEQAAPASGAGSSTDAAPGPAADAGDAGTEAGNPPMNAE